MRVLVVWLILCHCCAVERSNASSECPAYGESSLDVELRDLGGLASLADSAKSTRNGIISGELPYRHISVQAGAAYNNASLDTNLLMSEWTSFTQNALFLGGFVLFVALLLPGLAVALWTFWECCYEEDEEEEEEENRNLTLRTQVVVWALAVGLVAMVTVLVILVSILLVGNTWVSEGVRKGKEIAGHTIPQLASLRNSALQTLDTTVVGGYRVLTHQLQSNILRQVSFNVSQRVDTNFNSSVSLLNQKVIDQLSLQPLLLPLTHNLSLLLSSLPSLPHRLAQSLAHLEHQCNLTLTNQNLTSSSSSSSLFSACDDLLGNVSSYLPRLIDGAGGVGKDGRSLLSQLEGLLASDVFRADTGPLPWQLYLSYLEELETALSQRINSMSAKHLSSLETNFSYFVGEVTRFYNSSLRLGSQSKLEEYLGSRYLENWQKFRSALTITFSLLVFVGVFVLLLAVGRGLYNVACIYCYAEVSEYDHGAHQAGNMIKKIAFSFLLLCILSAAFSCFFLSVAGVLGKLCGERNNFSELTTNVIDNPATWSDGDTPHYPLAEALLKDPTYPLTVSSLLEACSANISLFQALHLEQRYDLATNLRLSEQDKRTYREDMRNVSVYLNRAALMSTTLEAQLVHLTNASLIPIHWTELTSLSPNLVYQPPLQSLKDLLDKMSSAVDYLSSDQGLSSALQDAIANLTEVEENLESIIHAINSTASQLHSTLSSLTPPLSTSLASLAGNISITAASASNNLVSVTVQQVNRQLELFINSTITSITCDLGSCQILSEDFKDFASSVCGDIVPGMDIFWTSLLIILIISVIIMPLALLLASRFVSLEIEKSNRKASKFYLSGAIVREIRGTTWQLLSLAVYLWWVFFVSRDEYLRIYLCNGSSSGCCEKCVWVFGIVFLVFSFLVGGICRTYQYFTVYMIKKCTAMKYRRFWIERRKAVNFYGQLGIFILQDLPFLVLAGTYANNVFLNVPTFYCLTISLIGIVTYICYLLREKQNIVTYWAWLKMELAKLTSAQGYSLQDPPLPVGGATANPQRRVAGLANGHALQMRSPYGSSGSDRSDGSSQGTYQEHGFEFHPPRLSDIPEYPEGGMEGVVRGRGHRRIAPVEPHLQEDDGQTDTEMSDAHSQFQSRIRLDRDVDFDSDAYNQRRREAIEKFVGGGVEVAPAYYRNRDIDTSTISESYYRGSRDSMELRDYYSSSQAPDTNSCYESSDYRDDCESEYSQAKYQLPHGAVMGEVTVDV